MLWYAGALGAPRGPAPEFNLEVKLNEKRGYIPGISLLFIQSSINKMSSSNVSLILSELSATRADVLALKSEVSSLRAALSAKSAPAAASGKPVAEKKPRKKSDAPPTAWRIFSDRVRDVLRSLKDAEDKEVYSGKALGVQCVQFAADLKDENPALDSWSDADIIARRESWSAPTVSRGEAKHGKGWAKTGDRRTAAKSGSVAASVASGDDDELEGEAAPAASVDGKKKRKNPWEGLTEEQRAAKSAAMKAGKAAKKATASSESADGAAAAAVAVVTAPPSQTSSKPPAVVASSSAAAAVAAPSSSGPVGFKKVALNNKRYWVNLENGHAYHRLADESQGEWAGLFSKTPKPTINESAPEPSAEEDEEEFALDE